MQMYRYNPLEATHIQPALQTPGATNGKNKTEKPRSDICVSGNHILTLKQKEQRLLQTQNEIVVKKHFAVVDSSPGKYSDASQMAPRLRSKRGSTLSADLVKAPCQHLSPR